MDTAQAVLLFVLSVLTVLLLVLGIQVFFILRELRVTVSKANKVLDDTGTITESVSEPISKLSTVISGVKLGAMIASKLNGKKSRNLNQVFPGRRKMNNNHGGSFHAFMWGAILGVGAVFLLGTKKGKQIMKTISEEGVELSELFDVEDDLKESPVKPQNKKCGHCKHEEKKAEPQQESQPEVKEEPATNGNGTVSKISRRFFRGTPKRS